MGRCSALTRRSDILLYGIVNCAPAKGYSLPDIDRHGRLRARGPAAGRCGSIAALCVRFTPAVAFLLERFVFGLRLPLHFYMERFVFDHACCLTYAPNRTACGMIRFYSAWVGIAISPFSDVVRSSGFAGSLWDSAFLYGDPDGVRGMRRTQSAARRKYVFARTYWLCNAFRGENAGAEMWKPHCGRPRLCQRVFDSLDSLLLIRGRVRFCQTLQ